jgi:CheY-like chemotaxis protein
MVLDFLMAEMNGLDAGRALRRVLPTVPLILYASFDDSLSEQAKLIGITEIGSKLLLKKPRALFEGG